MIYIIDNGQLYSSHALYFVEAGSGFSNYFNNKLIPHWVKNEMTHEAKYRIVGCAPTLTWYEGKNMTVEEFLKEFADPYGEDPLPQPTQTIDPN